MPSASRLRRWGPPLAVTVVVSGLLLLIFPVGFTNYDTIYYLLWGKQIALGSSPDYSPPLVPTPHPLYDLLGAVTTPLGDGSITVAVVIAYISLGLLAWLVYRLGKIFFDRPVGALAAVFIMTAAPILSTGLRAYIDIPFMVMCLTALLIEARRPRAGLPVLAFLDRLLSLARVRTRTEAGHADSHGQAAPGRYRPGTGRARRPGHLGTAHLVPVRLRDGGKSTSVVHRHP